MAFKRFWRSKNLRDICHRQIRPERSEEVFKKVLGGCRAEPYKPKFETPQKQKGHPKIGMSFSNYIRKDQNFRSTSTGRPVLSDSKAASMMSISTIIW